MTRVGSCNRCGKCCTKIGWIQENVVGFDEWAMARGLDVHYSEDCQTVTVLVPHVCPHYGLIGCDLHGTPDKPDVCVNYPVSPDTCLTECGFRFIETSEVTQDVQ